MGWRTALAHFCAMLNLFKQHRPMTLWSLWCRSPDLSGCPSDGWRRWHHQHTDANRSQLLTRAAALAKTYPDHQFAVTAANGSPDGHA
jgi:hypothetical protein